MRTNSDILHHVLDTEGGLVDDPDDAGGRTNFGITQRTLDAWCDKHGRPRFDVANLKRSTAMLIYEEEYIRGPGFDSIPDIVFRWLVVDSGVNHGPKRATRWLQRAHGIKPDGIFGPKTKEALAAHWTVRELAFDRFLAWRFMFYAEIVARRPRQVKFIRGWIKRACMFLTFRPEQKVPRFSA